MPYDVQSCWSVEFSGKAMKQFEKLPANIQERIVLLVKEMETKGPIRSEWKNYGKLGPTMHHCHVKKGRPTYVVCWEVISANLKITRIYYAGTHENAPY